jgi:hypothetical protein
MFLTPAERLTTVEPRFSDRGAQLVHALAPLTTLGQSRLDDDDWSEIPARLHRLMLALDSFDRAFRRMMSYTEHLYVVADPGVESIYRRLWPNDPGQQTLGIGLEILATLGLCFRFDIAHRYHYSERGLSQARINGWGRSVISADGAPANVRKLTALIRHHNDQYRELIQLLRRDAPNLNGELERANARVPIPIVA